jgi:D-glycero-D-manno-heptose 1,7-bisphosphate phosphatase
MAERSDRIGASGPRRALFVDRDGTLNPDLHYLKDASRIELFRGVGDALSLTREHGFLTICVTNQSGVERGLYTDEDVVRIHARLNQLLRPHRARIDAFYYCPHAPEHHCACRKPGTLLFERARDAWNIDLGASAIIGDRGLDVEAGHRLGMLTAIVPRPGLEAAAEAELAERRVRADLTASTFGNAALRILSRG